MTWDVITAGQSGRCAICDGLIDKGDDIVIEEGHWVHDECVREPDLTEIEESDE